MAAQFSEKELVDLTLAISLMDTYNRLAISFRRGPMWPRPTDRCQPDSSTVASASLLENSIDEAEQRVWSPFDGFTDRTRSNAST